jgi:hypothetical protein
VLHQRMVDQGVESAGPLVALDLLVPGPLRILRQPGPDAGHIAGGESFNRGRELLDCAYRRLASVR